MFYYNRPFEDICDLHKAQHKMSLADTPVF